ncbi:U-box domain-containing protein 15 [Platanthera guangdongensis]|uniref:U-box domain-containing protein 15 n=1 Tax=Platanthera guangdongensis TaxID=2320717 RepID=A0ABR2M699_9ASPA
MPTSPTPISSLTIRSNVFQNGGYDSSPDRSSIGIRWAAVTENFTDSGVDFRLPELVAEYMSAAEKSSSPDNSTDLLELSRDLSYFSSFSSDISGELRRLASLCSGEASRRVRNDACRDESAVDGSDLWFIEVLSAEILQNASLETAEGVLRSCVETLNSSSPAEAKRAAAGKLRLLAKHRSDFRELIGASGAIQSLIPLLRCTDPAAQENAVTALLNLSLEESNRTRITATGAIKPLVYALRTGTVSAKQNAACALLNLSTNEDSKITIGICGAIPPLVSLLMNGSSRGKKDALTTLYRLCGTRQNRERAVNAGAVTPLVALVAEGGGGTAEKAMVVLNSLSSIEEGRKAIVDEGGIPALVEAVEAVPARSKDFAVLTLLQLCGNSERNRELLVREGAIPPLVALLQSPAMCAKHTVSSPADCCRR